MKVIMKCANIKLWDLLGFFHYILNAPRMYIRCGTKNRLCHIDISKVGQSLSEENCKALQGLHAFTGCDMKMSVL